MSKNNHVASVCISLVFLESSVQALLNDNCFPRYTIIGPDSLVNDAALVSLNAMYNEFIPGYDDAFIMMQLWKKFIRGNIKTRPLLQLG